MDLLFVIKSNPKDPTIQDRFSQIKQEIQNIILRFQQLMREVNTTQNTSGINKYIFTRNLYLGLQGDDVRKLQEFLAKDKEVYPEGIISGYYGYLTQRAVQRFQCKYNIICYGNPYDFGYGVVGPKTRLKLNELINL
jgi:peptidoglycan hydrolase-like protein with peptidoglycan-binding domain